MALNVPTDVTMMAAAGPPYVAAAGPVSVQAPAAPTGPSVVMTEVPQHNGPSVTVLVVANNEPPTAVVEMAQQAARQLGSPSGMTSNGAPAVNEVVMTSEFVSRCGHLLASSQLTPIDPANVRRSGSDHVLRPAGLVLSRDMAHSLGPLGALRIVCIQGVAEGKVFAAEMTALEPRVFGHSTGHECRQPFLTNVYVSRACSDYGARGALSFADLESDEHARRVQRRDYCVGLNRDQMSLRYIVGGLARIGIHVTILGKIARVESFSVGRCEVWILPVTQKDLIMQPHVPLNGPFNGPFFGFAAGAAGVVSYLLNQFPEVATDALSQLGDMNAQVLLAIDLFRLKALALKACLSDHANAEALMTDLQEANALYGGHIIGSVADALAYQKNVLDRINKESFLTWKLAEKRIMTNQALFTRLVVMACPFLSGYFDVDRHVSRDFGHLPSSCTLPFVAVSEDGQAIPDVLNMTVTKEDVLFQAITVCLSNMTKVVGDVVPGLGLLHVLSVLAMLVPGFDNLVQAALVTMIRGSGRLGDQFTRPGCPFGTVLAKLRDSSGHLFLTKNELDLWDLTRVRKYSFPHHLLTVTQVNSRDNIQMAPLIQEVSRELDESGYDHLIQSCPTFEGACRLSGLFNDAMTEQMYNLTKDLDVVSDQHIEMVDLPPAVAAANDVPLATFLARKCLALTVQKWRDQSKEDWTLALVRYQ